MILTREQCNLLMQMVNASISMAVRSGIPIGKEYYENIEIIKEEINKESMEAYRREVEHF